MRIKKILLAILFTTGFFLANAQEIVMKGLLFPKNIEALNESVDWIKQEAQGLIDKLIAEPHNKRSYESTVLLYDQAVTAYKIIEAMTEAYALVCPDDLLRTACLAAHEVLQKKSFDIFYRPEVYEAFKQYAERVQEEKIILTPEQEYLLRECLRDCLREGLDKPRKLFEQIQQVKKELCSHAVMFEALIAQDNRFIIVEKNMNKVTRTSVRGYGNTNFSS